MARKRRPNLFADDGSDRGIALLNWRNRPEEELCYFADAYHQTAKGAIENLRELPNFGRRGVGIDDFLAYPALFLYRHALELHLKNILLVGADMLKLKEEPETPKRIWETHNVKTLGAEVERVFAAYGWNWNLGAEQFTSVSDFRSLLQQLTVMDPKSFSFRYPISPDRAPHLPEGATFNLFTVAENMDALLECLSGAGDAARAELDGHLEALHEALSESGCDEPDIGE
jgi:hypothetical protein